MPTTDALEIAAPPVPVSDVSEGAGDTAAFTAPAAASGTPVELPVPDPQQADADAEAQDAVAAAPAPQHPAVEPDQVPEATSPPPAPAAAPPAPAASTSADEAPPTPAEPAHDEDAVIVAGGKRSLSSVLPLLLVGLLTLALVATVALLALRLRAEQQTDVAREEAVAASRDAARRLFSYDHATLEKDFASGLAVTTGKFREQYSRTTKDVVSPVATQYKAVVVAEVIESAVIDAEPDEVTALVFLNQATTSTRVTGQQVDQSRVRMRLVERDGRWLVSEVKAL